MKVLVACEESQTVCSAFRELGHEAYSCDLQEPSGGHPEWHILGDALVSIEGGAVDHNGRTDTRCCGVGFNHCTSALHGFGGIRSQTLCTEAERREAAESNRLFYGDGACALQEGGCRESGLHHVNSLAETGSNYTAIPIRRSCAKDNLLVAERSGALGAHKCG